MSRDSRDAKRATTKEQAFVSIRVFGLSEKGIGNRDVRTISC